MATTQTDFQLAVNYELRTGREWSAGEWRTRCHELVDIYVNQEDREFLHQLIEAGWLD